MREISILKLLSTFSNKEKKDFKVFLESPGFVSRRKVVGLYEILLRDNPEMNDNFDKKSAYKELFPEEWKSKGYNDATMRNSLYELQRSAEKFLVFNKINSNYAPFPPTYSCLAM